MTTKPTTLYRDFAFAWTISGVCIVRARSPALARDKFDAMSRASRLNQAEGLAFFSSLVGEPSEAKQENWRGPK